MSTDKAIVLLILYVTTGSFLFGVPNSAELDPERANALFEAGNVAYQEEDYNTAVNRYEEATGYGESWGLRFNLANAYWRLGQIGPAILNFERALSLSPLEPDVVASLQAIREQSGLPAYERSLPVRVAARLRPDTWLVLAAALFWLGLALALLPLVYSSFSFWRRWFLAPIVLLLVGTVVILRAQADRETESVVLQPKTTLRVAPTAESPGKAVLPAGLIVFPRFERGAFLYVETQNGDEGYLARHELGSIWQPSLGPLPALAEE